MPLVAFAASVLGVLLWLIFITLLVPPLLGRLVAALLTQFSPARVSLESVRIYLISGSLVFGGLRVVTCDAVLEAHSAALTARWWRRTPPPDSARHPAAAVPTVFVIAFEGLRVRLVNNSNAYDALEKALRGDSGGAASASGSSSRESQNGPCQSGGATVEPESTAAWVLSRTSVRVKTGAAYVFDVNGEGDSPKDGVLRIAAKSVKLRQAVLKAPAGSGCVRREAVRASVSRLRVGAILSCEGGDDFDELQAEFEADGVEGAGGEEGNGNIDASGSRGGRGRRVWRRRRRRQRALPEEMGDESGRRSRRMRSRSLGTEDVHAACCPLAWSTKAVLEFVRDVPGPGADAVEGAAEVKVLLSQAEFSADQRALSVAQGIAERLSPPMNHLGENGSAGVPLSVKVEVIPAPHAPFVTVPFMPRQATWQTLTALEVRQWDDEEAARPGKSGRSVPAGTALPPSSMDLVGSRMTCTVFVPAKPNPGSGEDAFTAKLDVSDARLDFRGVADVPFIHAPSFHLSYSEKVQSSFMAKRVANVKIDLEEPRILYAMDCVRCFDDIAYTIDAHARVPETAAAFVPYECLVTLATSTGYCVRLPVQESNAWPSVCEALDPRPAGSVAEIRGKVGSVSLSSSAAQEFCPLLSVTNWTVELPDTEMFLVFPFVDTSMSEDEAILTPKASKWHASQQSAGSGQKTMEPDGVQDESIAPSAKERGLSGLLRNALDDAATSFSKYGLGFPTSDRYGGSASVARSPLPPCHSIRIAHSRNGLSVAGENSIYAPGIPLAVHKTKVHIRAGVVVVDANPYHLPPLLALVENLAGSMTHCLSYDERDALWQKRKVLEKEIAGIDRGLTQVEAFILGLVAGRIAHPESVGIEETVSLEIDVGSLSVRLHDVPSAMCPHLTDSRCLNVLDLGAFRMSSEATQSGMFVRAGPANPRALATLRNVWYPTASTNKEFGVDDPAVSTNGWHFQREVLFDASAAPYSIQTHVDLGKLEGALPTANVAALGRFQMALKDIPTPTVSPTMEAMWCLYAIRIDADLVDLVLPICDAVSLDNLSGVIHVRMNQGFRCCLNNLGALATIGHSAFSVPEIYQNVYTSCFADATMGWEGEHLLRQGIRTCEDACVDGFLPCASQRLSDLILAARLAPCGLQGTMHERPPLWSVSCTVRQHARLKSADRVHPRASYLWSHDSTASIHARQERSIELYDSPWWAFSGSQRVCKNSGIGGGSVGISGISHEKELHLSVIGGATMIVGPGLLGTARKLVAQRRATLAPDTTDGSFDVTERDILHVWRESDKEWCPETLLGVQKVQMRLSIERVMVRFASPLSACENESAIFAGGVGTTAQSSRDDFVTMSLPRGVEVALSLLKVPLPNEMGKLPYSILVVKAPSGMLTVGKGEQVMSASELDMLLRKSGHSPEERVAARVSVQSYNVGTTPGKDLESYSRLGRVVTVYGLMVRSLAEQISDDSGQDASRQLFVKDTLDAVENPVDRLGIACSTIYDLRRRVSTERGNSSHFAVWASPSPHGQLLGACGEIDTVWEKKCSVLLGAEAPLELLSGMSPHLLSTVPHGMIIDISCRLGYFGLAVMGQSVAELRDLKVEAVLGEQGTGGGIANICLRSLSLGIRDDIIAGLLNVASTIASHATRTVANVRFLQADDSSSRHIVLPEAGVPSSSRVTSVLANDDRALGDRAQSSQRLSRASTVLKALRRSASRQSGLKHRFSRDKRWSSHEPLGDTNSQGFSGRKKSQTLAHGFSGGSSVLRVANGQENGGKDQGPLSWLQKVAHRRETPHVGYGSRNNSPPAEAGPSPNSTGANNVSIFPPDWTKLTVLMSCGFFDVSYQRRRQRDQVACVEPDVRVTVQSTSGSLSVGPVSSQQSLLFVATSIAVVSQNEASCVFRGSIASLRACVSSAPGGREAMDKTLIASLGFFDVDMCLEAADIWSVLVFQEQFKEDVRSIGESVVTTDASIRTMLRAIGMSHVVDQSSGDMPHVVSGNPSPSFSSISVDTGVERVSVSLVGFHPADKVMRIAHEANTVFVAASVYETAEAVLVLGGRILGHSLVISASQWSSEERFVFPGLDICGVQWSRESELPTQLRMTTGPATNLISFQGLRNVLFASTGLLAFQDEHRRHPVSPSKISSEKLPSLPRVRVQEASTLGRAILAWERTKAVRMEMSVAPMTIGLESAAILLAVDVGNVAGTVEWNRFVEQGAQLIGALEVSKVSLIYGRSSSAEYGLLTRREKASLTVDLIGGRIDVLKSQIGLIHKFVWRFALQSIESVVKPWQFMEDAAVWSDEQDFIKEIQSMHMVSSTEPETLAVETFHGTRSFAPQDIGKVAVQSSESHEHRLLEAGFEIGSGRLAVPLLAEETVEGCRLSMEFREVHFQARLGDEQALPSQLNLTRVRVRSMGILWAGSDLFNSSQAQFTFAVKRSPQSSTAHVGSLRGAVSLGSWVVCPRQEVVLAIVDARLARQVRATRRARAKLGSIPDLLTRPSSVSTATATPAAGDLRVLFEHIEVIVLPSPGFIEGLETLPAPDVQKSRSGSRPSFSLSLNANHVPPRLQLPIPMFSIGLVRSPIHEFDLLDVNFSSKKNAKFPERCLTRAANLFSELFGAIASRTKMEHEASSSETESLSHHSDQSFGAGVDEATAVHVDLLGRDWSALVRFGESKYVATEDVYGKLQTRFSFYAGEGSGILASMLSPVTPRAERRSIDSLVPKKATVVAAGSPLFRLEIHPDLETANAQSLTLNGVKFLQGYANGLVPHTVVHVSEMKAELDIMTLLLSREWIARKRLMAELDKTSSSEAAVAATAHQAALALASAAPSETRLVVVLGDAVMRETNEDRKSSAPSGSSSLEKAKHRALLVRLRLSQPDGRVGLVVRKVHFSVCRERSCTPHAAGAVDSFLSSDVHLSIHQVTSLAEWEHLSSNCGFHSLHMRGDIERAASRSQEQLGKRAGGAALVIQKLRLKCERDGSDAFKLEVDGCALVGSLREEVSQMNLETTNVDAYISSLTIKTVNRLRQLQSRLRRGLKPQVERLLLAEMRRDRSAHSASIDSASFGLLREKSWRSQGTGPASESLEDDGMKLDASGGPMFPGMISITGDQLVVTMHGFSFDDNQPQAKLIFVHYDVDYEQHAPHCDDLDMLDAVPDMKASEPIPADWNVRLLSMRYDLLDVQYSDQRQKSITVMSLPDPHLSLRVLEVPEVVFVEFLTLFERTVEISASVSHYDYLNQLLTLYRSATRTSLSRTLSAMDPGDGPDRRSSTGSMSHLAQSSSAAVSEDGRSVSSSVGGSEGGSGKADVRTRWGGRQVVFKEVLFAPRLSPLGDLTPDVSSVLGWLGVGEVEALPGGLYDILMMPVSKILNGSGSALDMIGKGPTDSVPGDVSGGTSGHNVGGP